MLYIVYDEIDEKNWLFFEAPNDRAAKRIMRQNILKYQKDVDFEYSLRRYGELPSTENMAIVTSSDELFKSDEDPDTAEANE